MTDFWNSGSGEVIDGSAEKSFTPIFSTIPDGTYAPASIKKFELIEKMNNRTGKEEVYYQVLWRLTGGDFKNREVTQKIKAFNGNPQQIDRALNMMRRIYDLCTYKPTHQNAPTNLDLAGMHGKILGIKIQEWQMPKDGGGFIDGNFVSEVHALGQDFKATTGIKLEPPVVTTSAVETAFSRNTGKVPELDNDIPW
jgi:hypothetical protein